MSSGSSDPRKLLFLVRSEWWKDQLTTGCNVPSSARRQLRLPCREGKNAPETALRNRLASGECTKTQSPLWPRAQVQYQVTWDPRVIGFDICGGHRQGVISSLRHRNILGDHGLRYPNQKMRVDHMIPLTSVRIMMFIAVHSSVDGEQDETWLRAQQR